MNVHALRTCVSPLLMSSVIGGRPSPSAARTSV